MFKNKLLSFSNDGTYLAICNTEGILKLWNSFSNVLEHEFHPGEHLSSEVTCLKILMNNSSKNFLSLSNKQRKAASKTFDLLIAMGTVEGAILIYNPRKQKVTGKLIHAPTSSVTDLFWENNHTLVSIGDNKKLIIWNLETNEQLRSIDINQTKSLCIIKENHYITGDINIQSLSFNPKTKQSIEYTIPGHKTSICQLIPVYIQEKDANYFLSVAENDRFVYVWAVNSELQDPLASFMVNDIVRMVSCISLEESSILIAATTQKGTLRLFNHHLNGSKHAKPIRFKKSLQIENSDGNSGLLTILNATFISTTQICISYGTELFPKMERIKLDSITIDSKLSRQDPSVFTRSNESSLIKNVTPHVPANAVHLLPTHMNPTEMKEVSNKRKRGAQVDHLPMEERLDALSLTQTLPGVPDSRRPLDNYVHLLGQALHSKDTNLLNSILGKGDDEDVINNTVRRLPVSNIVPFLQYLQEVLTGKGLKNLTCINWIKSVLSHHMSHLSNIPEKENLLQPFYSVFSARMTSFVAVSKLHSRISLLLTQVKNRHENTTQSVIETIHEAKEDSSDDELDRLDVDGGPSESEDIWDDWNEDEEEDEFEDNVDNTSEREKSSKATEKRRLSSQNNVDLADDSADEDVSDEEEDEVIEVDDGDSDIEVDEDGSESDSE